MKIPWTKVAWRLVVVSGFLFSASIAIGLAWVVSLLWNLSVVPVFKLGELSVIRTIALVVLALIIYGFVSTLSLTKGKNEPPAERKPTADRRV